MDEVTQKLMEYLNGIESAVVQHAPAAFELAKSAVRMNSIADLIAHAAWLLFGLLVYFQLSNFFWKQSEAHDDGSDGRIAFGALFVVAKIVGIATSATSILMAASSKSIWFGLFAPELEIVRQLYTKILGAE